MPKHHSLATTAFRHAIWQQNELGVTKSSCFPGLLETLLSFSFFVSFRLSFARFKTLKMLKKRIHSSM